MQAKRQQLKLKQHLCLSLKRNNFVEPITGLGYVHLSPEIAPQGSVPDREPKILREQQEYRPVQTPKGPYETAGDFYSKRIWIC